jgi:uncharacterized protein (DUF427 family)
MAYLPETDVSPDTLQRTEHTNRHPDLGRARREGRGSTSTYPYASELQGRVALKRPVVLYESGFAPRWYVTPADIDESALTPVEHQTFCPYKGLCSDYDVGDARLAAWSYRDAYSQVSRISDLVSFEPDIVSVQLDGIHLRLEPGQTVIPHGPNRDLDVGEALRPSNG